ncbi:hypothetical protein BU25DRAFT_205722 [Macroventuria anomochaeta]|uniref:Uncharacterized protein n=1 Tax=Macroventuria anomochaeta TaxID=301207 RepID=A0ACB6RLJ9_9PLEO|nr:uncharacterized protein BU25DRAFT_205722 [Macroventuria anomochaeta]KAF2622796.1 hypothetical protein BU25DRAFT_205722 [Macroventuria anomochaeta]
MYGSLTVRMPCTDDCTATAGNLNHGFEPLDCQSPDGSAPVRPLSGYSAHTRLERDGDIGFLSTEKLFHARTGGVQLLLWRNVDVLEYHSHDFHMSVVRQLSQELKTLTVAKFAKGICLVGIPNAFPSLVSIRSKLHGRSQVSERIRRQT